MTRSFIVQSKIENRAGRSERGAAESKSKIPAGFTLIELLVVVTIILILAGLVLRTAGYVQYKGATARTEAEIKAIETALESYKVDYGDYPISSNSASNTILVDALVNSNTNYNPLGKVYLPLQKSSLSGKTLIDAFGQPYRYEYDPTNASLHHYSGSNFFDLWSTGGASTNSSSSNKWIKNW